MRVYFSRTHSEGFSFDSGGLGVATRLSVRNCPQPFAADRSRTLRPGEGFGEGLAWKRDVSDSCEIARKRQMLKCGG